MLTSAERRAGGVCAFPDNDAAGRGVAVSRSDAAVVAANDAAGVAVSR